VFFPIRHAGQNSENTKIKICLLPLHNPAADQQHTPMPGFKPSHENTSHITKTGRN